ncbi:MAG TPA: hypothetical protein PKY56_03740 [Candidatus Kapabacteria bacterium]|nr:hypothetical protein [Candidatus Kapabacteria bacterium]HPO62489.1 hypothetical protein [Candidatus Kapabacteria bacterium]
MKNIFFGILATLVLTIVSCTESTVNPVITNPNESILTKYVWVFESSSTSKISELKKMKFNIDKSMNVLTIDSELESRNWSADFEKNKLLIKSGIQEDTTTIVALDDSKLVIRVSLDGIVSDITYKPEINITNNIVVTGNITFDPTISNQDLSGAQVVFIWQTDIEEKAVVYGIGSINKNNKTFSIEVNESFPMSLFMSNSSKIDGYFNLGYTALVWNKNLKNGQILDFSELKETTSIIGFLEDRAMLFINGDYTQWDIDFLEGDFIQGFNFSKGFYMNQYGVNDKWIKVDVNKEPLYLRVLPGAKFDSFKFPNWS